MSIQTSQSRKRNPLLLAGFILLGLTSIAVIVYVVRFSNKTKVKSITPTVLIEGRDSIVQVRGKNFPDRTRISADFGGVPARIISTPNSSLSVVVNLDKLNKIGKGEKFSEDFVVRVDSTKILYSQKISIEPDTEIKVTDITPKSFRANSVLTLQGNNLNRTGQIEVYFGKNAPNNYDISQMQKAPVIPASRKVLSVRVPAVTGVVEGNYNVNIKVVSDGKTIYTTLGTFVTNVRPPIIPPRRGDTPIVAKPYRDPSPLIGNPRRRVRAGQ